MGEASRKRPKAHDSMRLRGGNSLVSDPRRIQPAQLVFKPLWKHEPPRGCTCECCLNHSLLGRPHEAFRVSQPVAALAELAGPLDLEVAVSAASTGGRDAPADSCRSVMRALGPPRARVTSKSHPNIHQRCRAVQRVCVLSLYVTQD